MKNLIKKITVKTKLDQHPHIIKVNRAFHVSKQAGMQPKRTLRITRKVVRGNPDAFKGAELEDY